METRYRFDQDKRNPNYRNNNRYRSNRSNERSNGYNERSNRYNNRHNNSRPYNNRHRNNRSDSDLNSNRSRLVDYIYKNVDLSKFNYKLLQTEDELDLLKDGTYHVSPNYSGINSLVVFTRIKNNFYSFMVDRRTLAYNRHKLDIDKVKITPISVRLDESIYNGSIMDGVLLYNPGTKEKVFMINDVYMFKGQNIVDEKINYKMINVGSYLKAHYKDDKYLNSVKFEVNTLYKLQDINKLVNNFILNSKYKTSIKGLSFFPETSGTKLIYLYSNCAVKDKVEDTVKDKVVVRDSKIASSKVEAVFRMDKTDTPDVYSLCLFKEVIKNNKKYGKYKKYCIAYVPTAQCSYFCKDILASKDSILVVCSYLQDKKRWIPVKEAPAGTKFADKITDVETT